MQYVNLSVYKFTDLSAPGTLVDLKKTLLEECLRLGLRGTVLLANEGMNCFVAGTRESIDSFKATLVRLPDFTDLPFKESLSDHQPFTRMLVKIKKEIITMGEPGIKPASFTGPRVSARTLDQWLTEKREVVLLDTRNDYEVRIGSFENAVDLNIKTFRQFPKRIDALPEEFKDKTIVSFCTGGIRCEKASALLLEKGFKNVYQLDGGILRYFEEVGASYFKGECFVFDHRVALNAELNETETLLCYNCQNPVTLEEQKSVHYAPNVSCPHCINGKEHKELIAKQLAQAAL